MSQSFDLNAYDWSSQKQDADLDLPSMVKHIHGNRDINSGRRGR
jgi:hypothetical protein